MDGKPSLATGDVEGLLLRGAGRSPAWTVSRVSGSLWNAVLLGVAPAGPLRPRLPQGENVGTLFLPSRDAELSLAGDGHTLLQEMPGPQGAGSHAQKRLLAGGWGWAACASFLLAPPHRSQMGLVLTSASSLHGGQRSRPEHLPHSWFPGAPRASAL